MILLEAGTCIVESRGDEANERYNQGKQGKQSLQRKREKLDVVDVWNAYQVDVGVGSHCQNAECRDKGDSSKRACSGQRAGKSNDYVGKHI